MQTSEKVIEDLLWSDLFKTQNVLDYCKTFIIIIVLLRIIIILFDIKAPNIYIHFIKAFAYGILVIMLAVYFCKDTNNINEINIFTGFTFLFSAIEVTDNLTSILVDIFGKGYISRKLKKASKEKDEKNFFITKNILSSIDTVLKPGRVSSRIKKYIRQLGDIYKETYFCFWNVDKIINQEHDRIYPVEDALLDIWLDSCIQNIYWKIEKENDGIINSKIIISSDDCERIRKKIEYVSSLHGTYIQNKNKLLLEKEKLDIVNNDF